jgi:hypothetical protein
MRRRHGTTTRHAAEQALEVGAELVADRHPARRAVLAQQRLHLLEDLRIHDGGVLPGVNLTLVAALAQVGDVGQQAVEAGAVEGTAAALAALTGLPALAHPAAARQLLHHRQERLVLQVELEDGADAGGLFLVD